MPVAIPPLRSLSLVPVMGILGMTGCMVGPENDPGLTSAIRAHYTAHATEEQGVCRSPKIDTIQDRRLVDMSAEGEEVMLVRYSYFDSHADMDAAYDKLVHLSQPCGGIAERQFTLTKTDVGYHVTDMGGEHKSATGPR